MNNTPHQPSKKAVAAANEIMPSALTDNPAKTHSPIAILAAVEVLKLQGSVGLLEVQAIIDKHISPLHAEIERLRKENGDCALKISDLSTKVANEHRLYELAFDNQTRWMDKCGTVEKQLVKAEQDRDSLQIQVDALREALERARGYVETANYGKAVWIDEALSTTPSPSDWVRRSEIERKETT